MRPFVTGAASIPAALFLSALPACSRAPEEIKSAPRSTTPTTAQVATVVQSASPFKSPSLPQGVAPDPLGGRWSLEDATRTLMGKGPLVAHLTTDKGTLDCALFEKKAPRTVANFVGLAMGTRPWLDPLAQAWVKRPAYDGTKFYNVVKDELVQGGDPLGTGAGYPGYTIDDESWPGATHDRAGLLAMARRGPDTTGSQFYITDGPAPALDGQHTIIGECAPLTVVHDLASVQVVHGSIPIAPVYLQSVTVTRSKS